MESAQQLAAAPLVHVIDDNEGFRTSVVRLLTIANLPAVGYSCAGDFLLATCGNISGCLLLDISMPGPSGVDLLKALVARDSTAPIIFVTARNDVFVSVDVMKTGAFDYILKPVNTERLLSSVHKAMRLDEHRRTARRELAELRRRYGQLTESEKAIFAGVSRHRLNKQLAVELGACERTIKAQRARMMEKLQLSTVPELVRAARLLKIPDSDRKRGERPSEKVRCALPQANSYRA